MNLASRRAGRRVALIAVMGLVLGAAPSPAQTAQPPTGAVDTANGQSPADPAVAPSVQLRGFGDIQFRAVDDGPATTTFGLGQLDLFVTSGLGNSLSVLAEMVIEANEFNEVAFEIERLQLQYFPNDHLKLIVGRFHANLGYYNTAYHHGTWFQTAVRRPMLFAFEDEGGILPIHDVGVSATGLASSRRIGLHYIAEVGNGRDWTPGAEPVQNESDHSSSKAVNVGFFAQPERWTGFQAGASVYRDRISRDAEATLTNTIVVAHAVYQGADVELLSEFALLQHRVDGGATYRSPAGYAHVSRRFGHVRPYARYEFIDVDPATPLIGATGRSHGPSAGVRIEPGAFTAVKVQYDRRVRNGLETTNGLTVQLAFTF